MGELERGEKSMVDENQVEQYTKAVKVDALHIEATRLEELKKNTVENSPAFHKLALQWAFNAFCSRKASNLGAVSIGDKHKLYDTLAKVAETLGVQMPI